MKVLIIGGDRRMVFAKDKLIEYGYTVDTMGLNGVDSGDINGADIILLPVPATRDLVNINCPITNRIIPLDILKNRKPKTRVFGGGKLPIDNYTDFLLSDEYAIKNAALTAEGAISYAIEQTDFSLWQSSILVIGYGRVGKALVSRLTAFAPRLTVSARSGRDFSTLDTLGINHIKTNEISTSTKPFDIVFNTVDIKLDLSAAERLKGALFIDLASKGGFDGEYDGITYKKLPGIPGKTAPITAGKIIAETVINSLDAKGEKYA